MYLWFSSTSLDSNTLCGNAADRGGGLLAYQSQTLLTNNVVADNRAEVAGGGIHIENSSGRLVHTTIARNQGGDGGGVNVTDAPEFGPSSVYLTNTIMVSHTIGINVTSRNSATLEATLWFGNEEDTAGDGMLASGEVNVYGAPAFTDPGAGDYHLLWRSEAIDRGVRAGVDLDIDGEARPDGCLADLGADEYQGRQCHPAYLPVAAKGD
jgi:hypothetical protein